MEYNLKEVREMYSMTITQFAKIMGISENRYRVFESENIVPCKYVYALWEELDSRKKRFPIPDDFFYYTSATLLVNLSFYHKSEIEIGNLFGIRQSTISSYVSKPPMPMYELKDKFNEVFPELIIPFTYNQGSKEPVIFTKLEKRGNFVSNMRKAEYKKYREENGLTTEEHRKLRQSAGVIATN